MSVRFHAALTARLEPLRDPVRAARQRAYMKSAMPFIGITAPVLERVTREVIRDHRFTRQDAWLDAVLDVWRQACWREQRYAAIQLAGAPGYRDWLDPAALPAIEEMIVTGAWWDFVDPLAATHLGHVLARHPRVVKPLIRRWSRDPDIWRRRAALLAQLKFRAATDERLLFEVVTRAMDSPEFFLRKAIGWALREYSKTAPDAVVAFVRRHREGLSNLSRREALRILVENGTIAASIPAAASQTNSGLG